MMKHFIFCIRKKVSNKKDVEFIFTKALINFDCSKAEYNIVKQFISESLQKLLGYESSSG